MYEPGGSGAPRRNVNDAQEAGRGDGRASGEDVGVARRTTGKVVEEGRT